MAFKQLGVSDPNDLVKKIVEFARESGWNVVEEPIADLDIINDQMSDGIRASISTPDNKSFFNIRSANGYQIFNRQRLGIDLSAWYKDPKHLDQDGNYVPTTPPMNNNMYGVGITASSAHSTAAKKWFDHADAPKYATANNTGDVLGIGVQFIKDLPYAVFANCINDDNSPVLIFSICHYLTLSDGTKLEPVFQQLVFGNIKKIGSWNGGQFLSGTSNSYRMFSPLQSDLDMNLGLIESNLLRIFGTEQDSSTFLRIDMDDAPSRGYIIWASSGSTGTSDTVCYTGKQMSLPIRSDASNGSSAWAPKTPHYYFLQSQNPADQGRNSNTLNCITVNLPLMLCVVRDPDKLRQFSPVGYIPGIYFISLYSIASAGTYEINYPTSGDLYQVFPMSKRGGIFGYDGISIKQ